MWLRSIFINALILLLVSVSAYADTLELVLMPGKVIQGHAKYESECRKCHVPFEKAGQNQLCLDCHKEIAGDVKAQSGLHGRQVDKDCKACHTDHKGRDAKIVLFDKDTFDHAKTDFPLRGGHAAEKVKCQACHKAGKRWREAPHECQACHRKDDVHKGRLGVKCAQCHNEKDWKEAKFDHDKTRFQLRGGHEKAKCASCHPNRKYKPTPRTCIGCHKKDDQEKGHKGRYGVKCETCHVDSGWKTIRFDHDRDTKYPLRGKHREAKCDSCHKGPLYKDKLKTTCLACHRKDDVHKGAQGPKCESCHSEKTWKTSAFDHDKDTKFILRGKHRETKCETCHKPVAAGLPKPKLEMTCISCHRKNDQDKGHKGRYGIKCETCHGEQDWKASRFDHDRDTKYLLRGKHRQTKCDDCHRGRLYEDKLKSDCYFCHEKKDVHKGKLGERCDDCHGEQDWKETRYDHGRSKFPLTGMHVKVECKKCHTSQLYRDTSSLCVDCHRKDDVHKKRLGPKCESCHNARSWKSWDFNHDKTRYPLDGAHGKVACEACHNTPVEKAFNTPRTCVGCHTQDDVHEGDFGPICERCHTTKSFLDLRPGINMR